MVKTKKKTLPRNPQKAMKFLLEHSFKHPQTTITNTMRSVELKSNMTEENAIKMKNADGKDILYITIEKQNQEKDKDDNN